jgi:hypothetical protein
MDFSSAEAQFSVFLSLANQFGGEKVFSFFSKRRVKVFTRFQSQNVHESLRDSSTIPGVVAILLLVFDLGKLCMERG